ncbi:hypothetical protein [Flavobacterium sp. 25HG05S-40]|uniref:hypothetical protein n=1 Tax=Flavobacterium sp. 25HG05S-40 TaxID=3458682 RepID=UPI00404484CD
MNNKIFLLIAFLFSATNILVAQKVEIKDDKVLLDGKEILKYEKVNFDQHSFYSLTDDEEILMYKYNDNESRDYKQDDYIVLNFLTAKKKIESGDITRAATGLGMSSKKNMEKLVTWLLKEKVFDANGVLNTNKVDTFYEKYNENITERTIR